MTILTGRRICVRSSATLFRVKKGKEIHYTYSDAEQDKLLAELKAKNKNAKIEILKWRTKTNQDSLCLVVTVGDLTC